LREAAAISGMSIETMRRIASLHDIGRKIGGQWKVSRVALAMWLEGNRQALSAYLAGDRSGPLVRPYFERLGIQPMRRPLMGDSGRLPERP
jgi:hypothetical protein